METPHSLFRMFKSVTILVLIVSVGTAHRESINLKNSTIMATENITTANGRSRFS